MLTNLPEGYDETGPPPAAESSPFVRSVPFESSRRVKDVATAHPTDADRDRSLVDIVDANDVVIATVTRRRMRAENLRHRGVGIAVLNGNDQLLVHRRADDKDVWPGYWDVAAGGVVEAGETYDEAAERELAEEVGIEGVALISLGHETFEDDDVRVITHCYLARFDGEVRFNDGEVVEARWVSPAEYQVMRAALPFCPDSASMLSSMLGAVVAAWMF